VVPCFNQAQFLGEAIESVLAQTYPHVELVVVDDGSSDNTVAVAGRYPGIRYHRQSNRGAPSARNTGLAKSNGTLVVFLDGDDRLLPAAIEVGVDALGANPDCAASVGACRNIDPGGRPLDVPDQPLIHAEHYLALLKSCFILSGSSVMFRRAAMKEVGGFDHSLALGDDYDLYLRLARRFPIHCHGRIVTEYRRHAGSLTRDPALTMRGELNAMRRQRGQVRGAKESSARRSGIRRARRLHGQELSVRLSEQVQAGRWDAAVRSALTMCRAYPAGLASSIGDIWRIRRVAPTRIKGN
jgi:glycosyltransferase involved in cell wall biosynthesis